MSRRNATFPMHTFCTVRTNLGGYMYITVLPVQRYMQMEIGPTFVLVTKKGCPVCSVCSITLRSLPGFSTTPVSTTQMSWKILKHSGREVLKSSHLNSADVILMWLQLKTLIPSTLPQELRM